MIIQLSYFYIDIYIVSNFEKLSDFLFPKMVVVLHISTNNVKEFQVL